MKTVKAAHKMNTAHLHFIGDFPQKNTNNIFLAQITRRLELFLENDGFKNSTPPKTEINGGKIAKTEKL